MWLNLTSKPLFILLLFITIGFISSCKPDSRPKPFTGLKPEEETRIYSSKLKPKIRFSYETLDSGGVKFTNLSAGYKAFKWHSPYQSKAENPTFYLTKRGNLEFRLQFETDKGVRGDTLFRVLIANTPTIKEDSSRLYGTIFNNVVDISMPLWNDFYGGGVASLPLGTPSAKLSKDGYNIILADFMPTQGKDYATVKNNFKPGKQPLAELKEYPTGDYSLKTRGWYVIFTGKYGTYATGRGADDLIEIVRVEEINQRKLFPEMEERAFRVTWHIKADAGEKGKIDCFFQTKYIIYKQYFDY
jgi:hypothetical protein